MVGQSFLPSKVVSSLLQQPDVSSHVPPHQIKTPAHIPIIKINGIYIQGKDSEDSEDFDIFDNPDYEELDDFEDSEGDRDD